MQLLDPAVYQPALHARFARVHAQLQPVLPEAVIEHVGASAVPGLWSKGDLDVLVIVAPDVHASTVTRLMALGYAATRGTLRTDALCMLEWPAPEEAHALQVVARGSRFESLFLQFRDALRRDPARVAEYNHIKAEAAGQGETAYRAAKAGFIEAVLATLGGQAAPPR